MEHGGKTLCGRYRLDDELGAGGMGTVYAATHLRLNRSVAVKLLKPEVSRDATLVERFFREARTAASVNSIGIVDVLDLDIDPELGPFMVMERLNGEPLVDVLPRGPLPPERAIQIIADMLDVLGAVHAKGIVHRDLKPPNVFLHRTEDGKEIVKVLDFGIAQLSFARMTLEGAVIGTPRWMAPEQARGLPGIDHRVDLYASGLLLYSALCGQPPYHDVASREIVDHLDRGPTPLRTLAPSVPEALHALVDRSLAARPADRFQSAAEMAAALREVELSEHPEISATRVSPALPGVRLPEPKPRAATLRPLGASSKLLGLGALGLVLIVALVIGAWLFSHLTADASASPLLQMSAPIPSTCPVPAGDHVGVANYGNTFVWTSGGNTLRVTAEPTTLGIVAPIAPAIRIESGTYSNSRLQGGVLTVHEFDPSRSRARLEFSNVTLFRADGSTCTLFGTANSF